MPLSHTLKIIRLQTLASLRTEAVRTHLSVLWWVIEPVLYMLTFYIVFGLIFERGGEGYVGVLLIGLVMWRWFDSTVRNATTIVGKYAALMHQVYLPKTIFPAVLVSVNTIKATIIIALLLVFLVFYGVIPGISWAYLPIVLLIQLCFIAGMTFLLASISPFLPDLQIVVTNLLTFLFFMSGVFFDLSAVPEQYVPWLKLNPMMVLIDSYRQILLYATTPDWFALLVVLFISCVFFAIGLNIFKRFDYRYPKMVSP